MAAPNVWAACGNPGSIAMYSPDGITWSPSAMGSMTPADIAWSEELGLAVAVGVDSGGRVMTSPDGVNWTLQTAPASVWLAVAWSGTVFCAVGISGAVMTSPDGINWTARTGSISNNWSCICWSGSNFVAASSLLGVGQQVMTSPDGITWTTRTTPTMVAFPTSATPWRDIAANGTGTVVAVAQGNATSGEFHLMYSLDHGVTWATTPSPSPDNWWAAITWGQGKFVAMGPGNNNFGGGTDPQIITSPDGITWTSRTEPVRNEWRCVRSNGERFVAIASGGTGGTDTRAMYSDDGETWVAESGVIVNSWTGVAWLGPIAVPPEPPGPIDCCPPMPQRTDPGCGDTSCGRAFKKVTIGWDDSLKVDGEYTFPESRLYPVETVKVGIPVGRETRHYRLTIGSALWAPLTIAAVEWTGQYFNNARRTG